jgi:hypothetical protein
LLKHNAFVWDDVTEQAFSTLKEATRTAPILVVPNFTGTFVLECNASNRNLGEMLMQEGYQMTFINKQVLDKNLGKSTYEKEMMTILHALNNW